MTNYVERAATNIAAGEFPSWFEEIAMQTDDGFRRSVERNVAELRGCLRIEDLGATLSRTIFPSIVWPRHPSEVYYQSCCERDGVAWQITIFKYENCVGGSHVIYRSEKRRELSLELYKEFLVAHGCTEADFEYRLALNNNTIMTR